MLTNDPRAARRDEQRRGLVGIGGTRTISLGFVAGTSYSGSTLLSFLLNAQPDVASIGEVAWAIRKENPGGYECSCGATLDTCQFWLAVSREMNRRGHIFDANHWDTAFEVTPNRLVRRLAVRPLGNNFADQARDDLVRKVTGWGRRLAEIGRRNTALIDSIAGITGASTFIDASKDPTRVRFLRQYCSIEPYVIHLVRDSLAFVNSARKNDKGARAFYNAILWWNRTAWHMERLRRTTSPERWLLVRYEDLCANPEVELKRILQFLGVAGGPPVLEFRQSSHHIIGNRMRRSELSQIRLDTSWRDELSKAQVDQIVARTRKYRQRFGYLDGAREI